MLSYFPPLVTVSLLCFVQLHIKADVVLLSVLAALPGKFQCCYSEEGGGIAKPPRTAGDGERNSQTQQNEVSTEWTM